MVDSFQKRERQRRTAEKNRDKQDRRREKSRARRKTRDGSPASTSASAPLRVQP